MADQEHDQRRDCMLEFEQIRKDLSEYKKDHDLVVVLTTKIEVLTDSVRTLTRSVWGVLLSMLLILAGFMIWFIQSDLH
jgi:hypothetical protein